MARKTDAEKLADIEKKLEQLKVQKQSIIAREKEKERKERNHRLIQIGAEIESRTSLTLDDVKLLCEYFHQHPENLTKLLEKAKQLLEPSNNSKSELKEK